jgi:hypothetical protein
VIAGMLTWVWVEGDVLKKLVGGGILDKNKK